jgi:hypothetical protein
MEGAPSLRFLQGWAAMLPTQLLSVLTPPVVYAVVVPALSKVREGRGTRNRGGFCGQKAGHPPIRFSHG